MTFLLLAAALQTLSMDQAVETALANQPVLQSADARTEVAAARAAETRAALRPQVDASARYSVGYDDPAGRPGAFADAHGASVGAGLLLYDFGRTRSAWQATEASAEAVALDARALRLDVILDVRLSYLAVLENQALLLVAQATLENETRHLREIEAFVEVGARPEIDVVRLRAQVAQARASLVAAENAVQAALTRLVLSMGIDAPEGVQVAEAQVPPLPYEDAPLAELLDRALAARPELAAQRASLAAQALRVKVAEKRLLPSVRAATDVSYGGADFLDPGWGAGVGVNLGWTIFDGGAARAGEAAERANLRSESALLDREAQLIRQGLHETRIALTSARAENAAAAEARRAAEELLRLAEARYRQGVGSSLELTDAQLELASAAAREVRTGYAVASARAQLVRALGRSGWD